MFDFEFGRIDPTPPYVRTFHPYKINRTTAEFKLRITEPVDLYYMVALQGTQPPTKEQLLNPTQYSSANLLLSPQFGSSFSYNKIGPKEYDYIWEIEGLTSQTDYTIYAYPFCPGQFDDEIVELDFTTSKRHPNASFKLRYTAFPLTD